MKKNTVQNISITLALVVCFGSVFADDTPTDLSTVSSKVVNLQATDTSLPSGVPEQKGTVGSILAKIFETTGKIGNYYIKALDAGNRAGSTGKILKWNGGTTGNFVDSLIQDNGSTVTLNNIINTDAGILIDGRPFVSGGGDVVTAYRSVGSSEYGVLEARNAAGQRGLYLGYGNGGTVADLFIDNASTLAIAGGDVTMGNNLSVAGTVTAATPTVGAHLTTKSYVDAAITTGLGGDSVWTTSGTNIYNANTGNVGIGNVSPGNKLDVAGAIRSTGNTIVNNTSPTTYYQDTDNRTAMVHVNSNQFYVLRGDGTGSTVWATFGGRWPLQIDLESNYATFGGTVDTNGQANHGVIGRTTSTTHAGVIGYSQNGTTYGILGHANTFGVNGTTAAGAAGYGVYGYNSGAGIGVYGQSAGSYGVTGRTTDVTQGGIVGYNHNVTAYGMLGYGTNYGLYGVGDAYVSGNVGIGVAPTLKLDVAGQMRINSVPGTYDVWIQGAGTTGASPRNLALLGVNSNDTLHVNYATEYSGGTVIGGNTTVTGNVTATSFLYSSDRTLKTHIQALENSTGILSIGAKRFDWKDTKNQQKNATGDIGVIAQDVEKYFPEFVYTDKEGIKTVDYVKLVVPLMDVVQKQEQRLQDLETKIEQFSASQQK